MKIGIVWAAAALVGSSSVLLTATPTSYLELSCAPAQIQNGAQIARVNFCQTSSRSGQMTILQNNGFGEAPQELLKTRSASLVLSTSDSKIVAQSGDFVIEAKPIEGEDKSWHAILKNMHTQQTGNLSCRVEFVSDCKNSTNL